MTDPPALDTTAVRLLDAAVPGVPDAGPHDPRLRLPVPHTLALLGHIGGPSAADALAVATRLSVALHRTGDYLSAWEAARNAADLAQRHLGADHRAVLAARSRAGRALFRLGRYAEAAVVPTAGPERPAGTVRESIWQEGDGSTDVGCCAQAVRVTFSTRGTKSADAAKPSDLNRPTP
ncbi:tetratricopeptide repeat protein [Streptomyces sp. JB150]|uniref:tetratricopeptide repeat protein n=1 Tax=Streptomyces sp. JB150 TaxID=2714844 RepID=UPI003211F43D